MIEVNKDYYFIWHPYYHYIARVVEITGKHDIVTGSVVRVYRCPRGFDDFFRAGPKKDTEFAVHPDGSSLEWRLAFPWKHGFQCFGVEDDR